MAPRRSGRRQEEGGQRKLGKARHRLLGFMGLGLSILGVWIALWVAQTLADDPRLFMPAWRKQDRRVRLTEEVGTGAARGANVSGFESRGVVEDEGPGAGVGGEAYHDSQVLRRDYEEMVKTFKVFVYPVKENDPFRDILEPVEHEPTGNYASESYFKKLLLKSNFVTTDAREAHLFFMPFSIATMRHDPRIGVDGIQDFVSDYVEAIRQEWPFWNRTGGADHFYLACHSVARDAMKKALDVRIHSIQLVCSSSYYLHGFIPHKDASVPQIWPRKGGAAGAESAEQRKVLAFFAGAGNSPVRAAVVKKWKKDKEMKLYGHRIRRPYDQALLTSKFCLHVKGFEVNTARVADAIYYGCVPVIIANYYDLPFNDILDWSKFSVVVTTEDVPLLKPILKAISDEQYRKLHRNVIQVKKHFIWHETSQPYDAFHMLMYELWLRRHVLRHSVF